MELVQTLFPFLTNFYEKPSWVYTYLEVQQSFSLKCRTDNKSPIV